MHDRDTTDTKYSPSETPSEVYSELAATDGQQHEQHVPEPVSVTSHAIQRYLERVDGTDPYPRSTIRRQAREARPVDLDDRRFNRTRQHPESGVVFVVDRTGAVTTCFRPRPEQVSQRRVRA